MRSTNIDSLAALSFPKIISERVGDVISRRIGIPGELTHPLDRSPQSRILRHRHCRKKSDVSLQRGGLACSYFGACSILEQRKPTSIGGEAFSLTLFVKRQSGLTGLKRFRQNRDLSRQTSMSRSPIRSPT
jgi:hypothetical protein